MRTSIVFTLTGKDRVGIVEEVTQLLLDLGGNVEASRMARLGGEFAILMLASLPSEQLAHLEPAVTHLTDQGYKLTTVLTEPIRAESGKGGLPFEIQVHGADHEGIIHEVAHYLSQRGINIESMDSTTSRAAESGTPLFAMTAMVSVPPGLADQNWRAALQDVARRLNVEIEVSAAERE